MKCKLLNWSEFFRILGGRTTGRIPGLFADSEKFCFAASRDRETQLYKDTVAAIITSEHMAYVRIKTRKGDHH